MASEADFLENLKIKATESMVGSTKFFIKYKLFCTKFATIFAWRVLEKPAKSGSYSDLKIFRFLLGHTVAPGDL